MNITFTKTNINVPGSTYFPFQLVVGIRLLLANRNPVGKSKHLDFRQRGTNQINPKKKKLYDLDSDSHHSCTDFLFSDREHVLQVQRYVFLLRINKPSQTFWMEKPPEKWKFTSLFILKQKQFVITLEKWKLPQRLIRLQNDSLWDGLKWNDSTEFDRSKRTHLHFSLFVIDER